MSTARLRLALPLLLFACSPKSEGPPPDPGDLADAGSGEDGSSPTDDTGPPDEGDGSDGGDSGGGDTALQPLAQARVILFIGDVMGFEHVRGGGLYKNGAVGSLVMETLPVSARIRTASYSGTTDSAAAATVMACGAKTFNGKLGIDHEDHALDSLIDLAHTQGRATGVVTRDKLYGATPSAFLVNSEDRYDSATIAAALIAGLPDFTLAGGRDVVLPLLDASATQILQTRAELLALVPDGRPIVGLFAPVEIPFVADLADTTDPPTLVEMTTTALTVLDADPDGFFLMVEGARIDHASHGNNTPYVHPETAAFDEAIAAALAWSAGKDNVTLIVTADHECGGMQVVEGSPAGAIPETTWRWGKHTNADVPLYGIGAAVEPLHGRRVDQLYVNAALQAALTGTPLVEPTVPRLADGWMEDLPDPLLVQPWETDFGGGFNQLDRLRVEADDWGLWLGIDGVFELDGNNAVLVLLDADFGAGTGWGMAGLSRTDLSYGLDGTLTNLDLDVAVEGLGFELAVGTMGATEVGYGEINSEAGLRGLTGTWGSPDNYGWLGMVSNFDDGNTAIGGEPARDAGATGETEGGYELLVPWVRLFPDGMPAEGLSLAFAVVLTNVSGTYASNQSFPAGAESAGAGGEPIPITAVLTLDVDGSGARVGDVTLFP
jgi:alkaline phosphatase